MLPTIFLFAYIFSLTIFVDTKRTQGILSSKKDFVYLDRFCFQSETGTLEYSFKYPLFYPTQMLLLYYDTEDQWPKAYKQLTTCKDRVQLLTNRSENNQIIKLSPFQTDFAGNGRCKIYQDNLDADWVLCMGTRIFKSARSRWWFLAVANCDPEEEEEKLTMSNESFGVYAEFSLQMTNGLVTEIFKHQFSIDEWLILPSDGTFLFLNVILVVATYIIGIKLSSRRLYHSTYRMCAQSITMNTAGLGFLVTNYIFYAMDGVGLPVVKAAGLIIRALADMIFVYVCLAIARGLNVSKMRLGLMDRVFLFLMILFFVSSYLLMEFWEIKYFDPALVYAQSESLPGYLLALWRLVAWLFFLISALLSRKAHEAKKAFFTYLVILMTPWFWAPPIFVLVANFALNNWVRAEVVNIVENVVSFYGYCVFLYLSRPTQGNTNFPFHIRTTQIDVDVGFDPHTAYGVTTTSNINDGLHGIPMELTSEAVLSRLANRFDDEDKGIPERPQIS
ncbi:unnamed protein product [Caenorhabditis angaria]|uniref:Intimal thickness related receptor IRP domain-containing protein n=1 Tax=Caenorhabditis angaria TaxID=860376 RepID=A0A9P1NAM9_9PELO|nr:unnamed protein product [Caenorhabditis angaria]